MSRTSVAAVVVTLNEERHIRRCLEHLAWCDERIVVDMSSEDRTPQIAAAHATAVLGQERIPHMEWARNRGIEAATADWILVIDADEVVPPALAERLRQILVEADDAAGYWLPRMNYCFGRPVPHVGGFPDYQLRLFRRGAGTYPDQLHSAPTIDGRAEFLPVEPNAWIEHLRLDASIRHLVEKWDVYAEKEARTRFEDGHPFAGPAEALWTALSSFRARFVTMRGYRDGMPGFVLSVLFAFYRFEAEVKLWEAAGCATSWDPQVGRLGSTFRLLVGLGAVGARRLARRALGRRPVSGPPAPSAGAEAEHPR